jgi:hypothetical protein
MNDSLLEDMAQRIRDSAVQRGGELLEKMKAKPAGNPQTNRGVLPPLA